MKARVTALKTSKTVSSLLPEMSISSKIVFQVS